VGPDNIYTRSQLERHRMIKHIKWWHKLLLIFVKPTYCIDGDFGLVSKMFMGRVYILREFKFKNSTNPKITKLTKED